MCECLSDNHTQVAHFRDEMKPEYPCYICLSKLHTAEKCREDPKAGTRGRLCSLVREDRRATLRATVLLNNYLVDELIEPVLNYPKVSLCLFVVFLSLCLFVSLSLCLSLSLVSSSLFFSLSLSVSDLFSHTILPSQDSVYSRV